MGGVASTQWRADRMREEAERFISVFVGEKPVPLSSEFWQEMLGLSFAHHWPQETVLQACRALAENNFYTRHLTKIMVILIWCLQELTTSGARLSTLYLKARNAALLSSIFLKYFIENTKNENIEVLYLSLGEEEMQKITSNDETITTFITKGLLNFISMAEISPQSCLLHHEVLNLMLVAMSTQLHSGPSPGLKDFHPFLEAAMAQEHTLAGSVVKRLLLTYVTRPQIPLNRVSLPSFSGDHFGVLQTIGSAAVSFVLLPYYTFNYLVNSGSESSRSILGDNSLLILLILIHYREHTLDKSSAKKSQDDTCINSQLNEDLYSHRNPYLKALENARNIEFDRVEVEHNAQAARVIRLPFSSLYDTLGAYMFDESSILLLYSLVHGNSNFLEYVLVRTDLDTMLMPVLEMLYGASKRSSDQIYMLLVILLILSQDSSFNASIHKLVLPSVPWYRARVLHHTSLGSLTVVVLIRTVRYNLSKLRDVYLYMTCLATLANMAPHVHRLNAYASQSLVNLFDMFSRKYMKSAEPENEKIMVSADFVEGSDIPEDMSSYLYIYKDFLRIVLEILNAIVSYALPQNPEIVYAMLHQQKVFEPFKSHSRFNELLENIYVVLDFFNSRIDTENINDDWSVEKVLQVIIISFRSWRGEGMKMFRHLTFTYEQEHRPEEFFIPYVWKLVLCNSGFTFDLRAIRLFPVDLPTEQTICISTSIEGYHTWFHARSMNFPKDPGAAETAAYEDEKIIGVGSRPIMIHSAAPRD